MKTKIILNSKQENNNEITKTYEIHYNRILRVSVKYYKGTNTTLVIYFTSYMNQIFERKFKCKVLDINYLIKDFEIYLKEIELYETITGLYKNKSTPSKN